MSKKYKVNKKVTYFKKYYIFVSLFELLLYDEFIINETGLKIMMRFEMTCPGHVKKTRMNDSGYQYCSGCFVKKSFVQTVSKSKRISSKLQPKP
jgi:hypothetical protein